MAQKRRTPEIIAGRVNSDGTIAGGDGFTVQKTGTGVYVILFASTFRPVSVVVSASGGSFVANVSGVASTGTTVTMTNSNTQVATDVGFLFVAVGAQT